MKPTILGALALLIGVPQLTLADSITGDPTAPTITSINDGAVWAYGSFGGSTTISGGSDNSISVSGLGASVTAQITKDLGTYVGTDTITIGAISTNNSGNVSSTGVYNNSDISSQGDGNSMSVLAAGSYVSLSIVHR